MRKDAYRIMQDISVWLCVFSKIILSNSRKVCRKIHTDNKSILDSTLGIPCY